MAKSTNRTNGMPKWFFVLLAVLVLLAVKMEIDEATDAGMHNGNASVGEQQSGFQDRPSDTVLAAVPADLRDNYFLDKKEMGCCKTLSGNVAVTVVLISDSVGQWDSESTADLKAALEAGGQDMVTEAATHKTPLSFSFHYYQATQSGDVCGGENTNDWQNPALRSAGLPDLTNLHNHLTEKYASKEAPVVFVFNKPGRAFAGGGGDNEYVVLFAQKNFSAFQHELSHVFGAKDFYYPKEVKTLATAAFPDSIMCSGETTDPLTAYLIGWTDKVSDSALQFLKDTNMLTAEYINAQKREEQYTGYGTKEYDAGTYTGDLVRGQRHGSGTMRYDNGGWYTGEWSYGGQSGIGTGKKIYEDGSVYEGAFLDGKRHGLGTYTWPNGSWLTGNWSDGEQTGTGHGRKLYDNGTYEGEFLDGKRHGQGTYTWFNGNKYTGQWTNGELTGYGTFTWADGRSKSGNWNNGNFAS